MRRSSTDVRHATRLSESHEGCNVTLPVDSVGEYATYLLEPDGRVRSWNCGAERLTGYCAGDVAGKSFTVFFTPEDRAAGLPERMLESARINGRFRTEGWCLRKDGSRLWATVAIDAIREDGGDVTGFTMIASDVNERQQATQHLFSSEAKYRQLVDAVVDYAIFQVDAAGFVTTWNAGAQRIKQYTPQEIIGRHFSVFYTEEDRLAGLPDAALAMAARDGRYESEGWRVRKDGTRFRALVVIDPITSDAGELIGFAKVTRDVSVRYEAEQKLEEAKRQLAASQKMEAIGQLSGGIAHDFNNLLMIVIGNLETAQRMTKAGADGGKLLRPLEHAMRGAKRAAALTSRLLAFSRRQALDPAPIDLAQFLPAAGEFIRRTIGETVQIETVVQPGLWPIEVDPNHLEAALVNLAINARDAMPDGGRFTIEAVNVAPDEDYLRINPALANGEFVAIRARDTGTGMTDDVKARAFEPFFTTKEVGHGTGLGLSQLYGFVKQSGGDARIESEAGGGTTVTMYFPRASSRGRGEDLSAATVPPAGRPSETVLVVEDDADLRRYLVDVLRHLDYAVKAAPNAQAALALLARDDERVDLMLTDLVMPGTDGHELGLLAQELRPGLPILYMTGYARNGLYGRVQQESDILRKPVSQTQLAASLRAHMDRRRQTEAAAMPVPAESRSPN